MRMCYAEDKREGTEWRHTNVYLRTHTIEHRITLGEALTTYALVETEGLCMNTLCIADHCVCSVTIRKHTL